MAFIAEFFNIKKSENSTLQPSGSGEIFNCILKDSCSIITPIIQLITAIDVIPIWNYCYISDFSRYYFIDDWEFSNRLWYAKMHVDVLASYKNTIAETNSYIIRSAAEFDGAVSDGYYPATSNITRTIIEQSSDWNYQVNTSYVIGVNGKGATTYYAMSQLGIYAFMDGIFSDEYAEEVVTDWTTAFPEIKAELNPLQYVTSIVKLPYNMGGGSADIPVGWGTSTGGTFIQDGVLSTFNKSFTIPKHPQSSRGSYLNVSPYTHYTLFYPPFGSIAISTTAVKNSGSINTVVQVDPRTGSATLRITTAQGDVISVMHGNVGVAVQIAGTVAPGYGWASVTTAAANVASNALSLNPVGLISSGIESIRSLVGSLVPSTTTAGGSSGGYDGVAGSPQLVAEFLNIVDEDNENRGRPLMSKRVISSIPGYMSVADAHVEIDGTMIEARSIENFMEGGFYFE